MPGGTYKKRTFVLKYFLIQKPEDPLTRILPYEDRIVEKKTYFRTFYAVLYNKN